VTIGFCAIILLPFFDKLFYDITVSILDEMSGLVNRGEHVKKNSFPVGG
jgi:hypothetical protein